MDLYNKLIAIYPELIDEDFARGKIRLQNDSDGVGDYIKKWEYSKPIPEGFSLGKPNA
jgi:hypothetical protein